MKSITMTTFDCGVPYSPWNPFSWFLLFTNNYSALRDAGKGSWTLNDKGRWRRWLYVANNALSRRESNGFCNKIKINCLIYDTSPGDGRGRFSRSNKRRLNRWFTHTFLLDCFIVEFPFELLLYLNLFDNFSAFMNTLYLEKEVGFSILYSINVLKSSTSQYWVQELKCIANIESCFW